MNTVIATLLQLLRRLDCWLHPRSKLLYIIVSGRPAPIVETRRGTSFSDSSAYIWELNPGLTNTSDPFYQHQGPQGGSCWATIAQITSAVQTHEVGTTQSHYSEVKAAWASENPATVANTIVGSSQYVFGQVAAAYSNAFSAGTVEPPTDLPANINYSPYSTCH